MYRVHPNVLVRSDLASASASASAPSSSSSLFWLDALPFALPERDDSNLEKDAERVRALDNKERWEVVQQDLLGRRLAGSSRVKWQSLQLEWTVGVTSTGGEDGRTVSWSAPATPNWKGTMLQPLSNTDITGSTWLSQAVVLDRGTVTVLLFRFVLRDVGEEEDALLPGGAADFDGPEGGFTNAFVLARRDQRTCFVCSALPMAEEHARAMCTFLAATALPSVLEGGVAVAGGTPWTYVWTDLSRLAMRHYILLVADLNIVTSGTVLEAIQLAMYLRVLHACHHHFRDDVRRMCQYFPESQEQQWKRVLQIATRAQCLHFLERLQGTASPAPPAAPVAVAVEPQPQAQPRKRTRRQQSRESSSSSRNNNSAVKAVEAAVAVVAVVTPPSTTPLETAPPRPSGLTHAVLQSMRPPMDALRTTVLADLEPDVDAALLPLLPLPHVLLLFTRGELDVLTAAESQAAVLDHQIAHLELQQRFLPTHVLWGKGVATLLHSAAEVARANDGVVSGASAALFFCPMLFCAVSASQLWRIAEDIPFGDSPEDDLDTFLHLAVQHVAWFVLRRDPSDPAEYVQRPRYTIHTLFAPPAFAQMLLLDRSVLPLVDNVAPRTHLTRAYSTTSQIPHL